MQKTKTKKNTVTESNEVPIFHLKILLFQMYKMMLIIL